MNRAKNLEGVVTVEKKKVGVIIPSMGNKKYVLNLIPTIKSSFYDVDIVSIDNGSYDGLTQELQKLRDNNTISHLEIYEHPIGVSAAWNKGIRRCVDMQYDYFMVLNSDILLHPDTIDNMVEFYENNKTLLVATAQNINPRLGYGYNVNLPDSHFDQLLLGVNSLDLTNQENSVGGPDFACFMLTKSFVDIIGYFDENFAGAYFEDNDAHWRIIKSGRGAASTNKSGFFHFGSRSIYEGGYHNSNFSNNESYFKAKHGTHTTDGTQCPGWTNILGSEER